MNDESGMPDDIAERISDLAWRTGSDTPATEGPICIQESRMLDAINWRFAGYVEIDGESWGFAIEMGDWVGFAVHRWELDGSGHLEPEPIPERKVLAPHVFLWDSESAWRIAAAWDKSGNFRPEWLGEYAYDRVFAPGRKTEDAYRDRRRALAAEMDLAHARWVPISEVPAEYLHLYGVTP